MKRNTTKSPRTLTSLACRTWWRRSAISISNEERL